MSWAVGTESDSETNDDHSIARSRVPQVVAEEGKEGGRQTDRQRQAATPAALTAAYFEDDESKSRSE